MTTIAYRDGVLAADTLMTFNTHRDGHVCKIAKRGRCLAAVSGNWPLALRFLGWFALGLPAEQAPSMTFGDDGAVGIVFHPDGFICCYGRVGWSWRRAPYYAEGSGCDYAYGAMAFGASAEEAVRAALMHECASGGEIQTLRH